MQTLQNMQTLKTLALETRAYPMLLQAQQLASSEFLNSIQTGRRVGMMVD